MHPLRRASVLCLPIAAAAAAAPPISNLVAESLDPMAFAPNDFQKIEGAHELHLEELRLRMVSLASQPLLPLSLLLLPPSLPLLPLSFSAQAADAMAQAAVHGGAAPRAWPPGSLCHVTLPAARSE